MIFKAPYLRKSIRTQGEKSTALNQARGRVVIVGLAFLIAYSAVALRAFDLSVLRGVDHGAQEEEFYDYTAATKNVRGDIVDRNGVLLATTLPSASLFADPALIMEHEELAGELVKIFPALDYGATLQKLQAQSRFVWLERNISPQQQHAVLQLGQPGLGFEHETRRYYPQGALASHLVGYTNVDDRGLGGVERSFDTHLGEGKPLKLSLDIRLQHVLHREISQAISDFTAKAGAGVIMDANTGEILAGVSLPDFDPSQMNNIRAEQMFNNLTLGVYELGSMFKIFSTAAVLDLNKIALGYEFDAREPIKIGRFTINDYHAENRILTVPEVFMYSSNIGSAKMGEMVGTEALRKFYSDLGLLERMEFEINEIGRPMVPSPWRDVHTLTASYGHGVATTPLQMSAAVASIVNGGLLVKPRLVIDDAANSPENNPEIDSAIRVISPQTSLKMRGLLRLVVTEGTGGNADVPGYEVGGKTGTAEKIGANGRYDRKRLISSFVAAFPASDPKYVVMIMVDEPKGNKKSYGYATAGWVAAPPVARTVSSMAAILGLPPAYKPEEQDFAHPLKQYVSAKESH